MDKRPPFHRRPTKKAGARPTTAVLRLSRPLLHPHGRGQSNLKCLFRTPSAGRSSRLQAHHRALVSILGRFLKSTPSFTITLQIALLLGGNSPRRSTCSHPWDLQRLKFLLPKRNITTGVPCAYINSIVTHPQAGVWEPGGPLPASPLEKPHAAVSFQQRARRLSETERNVRVLLPLSQRLAEALDSLLVRLVGRTVSQVSAHDA